MSDKISIGGQAVIEGVMMKGPNKYAVAVRKPNHEIEVKTTEYKAVGDKVKILKIPFIRGVFNFIESLSVGVKTLSYSSNFYDDGEEPSKADIAVEKVFKDKTDTFLNVVAVVISLVFTICLFMLLPAFITGLLSGVISNNIILVIIEGVIRIAIFLIYVALISQMKDIKRVFMYHGAEHKTINCFESGKPLTVENIKKCSRYHKRCGTSFLFVVMIISIFVFMFITTDNVVLRLVYRVLLVPIVASISYEFIKFAGRSDSVLFHILSLPGMWVQRLTTKEPDASMIEVAIKSVEGVIDWRAYMSEEALASMDNEETLDEYDDEDDEYSEYDNLPDGDDYDDTLDDYEDDSEDNL